MNRILWIKSLFLVLIFFSCGKDGDFPQLVPDQIKPETIYGKETAEEIFNKYGCYPKDAERLFVVNLFISEKNQYRYLIGRYDEGEEGMFWVSKFTPSGDFIWEITPFVHNSHHFTELETGDILISKLNQSNKYTTTQTIPCLVNSIDGSIKYVDVKEDFIYTNIISFDNFFFLTISNDELQKNPNCYRWFYQVDYAGKVLAQNSWMNIPDPNPLWLKDNEFIAANSYQIVRKELCGEEGLDIWKYDLQLPSYKNFTPQIYLEKDSVVIDYHLVLPDGSTNLYTIKLSTETGEPDKSIELPNDNIYQTIGVPAIAPNGLTVSMNSIDITKNESGTLYYTINYTVENQTKDLIELEGHFQMMYNNITEGDIQYGFFNNLYPGESISRSYTFRSLDSSPFQYIYYRHDFLGSSSELIKNALKWKIELPF